jgi:hypothetical protein
MSLRVIAGAIVASLLVSVVFFSVTERVRRRRMSMDRELRRRLRV